MKEKGKFLLFSREEFSNWLYEQNIKRKIKVIQNHHTYNPSYRSFSGENHFRLVESMEKYHMTQRNMSEIAQNITTFHDGTIMLCRTLEKDPGCFLGSVNNAAAICIEHVGNFDIGKDAMTEAHKKTIIFLNALLCKKFDIIASTNTILYHHFVSDKSCPGTNFFGGNTKLAARDNFVPLIAEEIESLSSEKEGDIVDSIKYLNEIGIIDSPDYWIINASLGKTIKGEFAAKLLVRLADEIKSKY